MADNTEDNIGTDPELVNLLSDLQGESEDDTVDSGENAPAPPAAPVTPAPVLTPVSQPSEDEDNEVRELLTNFKDMREEILANYRGDRSQVEGAIKRLEDAIIDGNATEAIVDNYIKAISVKADINSNAIKILDSIAKLMSAGKGTNIFIRNEGGISANELERILNAPKCADEK